MHEKAKLYSDLDIKTTAEINQKFKESIQQKTPTQNENLKELLLKEKAERRELKEHENEAL